LEDFFTKKPFSLYWYTCTICMVDQISLLTGTVLMRHSFPAHCTMQSGTT
jgi:hypothetical protein